MLLASTAAAQAPLTLTDKIVKSSTMDADAKKQVATFIQGATTMLRSDDPSQVRKGRESFTKSIGRPDVNPAFRTAFATMALPGLKEIVGTKAPLQAVNAIESMKVLNCPDSLSALIEQASPAKQKNESLRLAAAAGLSSSIRQTDLNTAQADAMAKALGSSIDKETDWRVTAYEIQALEAMSISPKTPKASQSLARVVQASALNSLIARIRKGQDEGEMIRAVNRSLGFVLSEQVGASDPATMAAFTKSLESGLNTLKDLAKSPPAGQDPALFTQASRMADTLLKTQLPASPAKPRGQTTGAGKSPTSR